MPEECNFKVGIVGAGNICRKMHLPVLSAMTNVDIQWIYDIDAISSSELAKLYKTKSITADEIESAAEKCDAVLLAVPIKAREYFYKIFSQKEVGLLVEKPFANALSQHRRITGFFEDYKIGCAFQRRTYLNTRLLKKIITEKWFGDLKKIFLSEGDRITKTGKNSSFIYDPASNCGGVLLDLGCHSLDVIEYLCEVDEFKILKHNLIYDGNVDVEAVGQAEIYNKKGATVNLSFSYSWIRAIDNFMKFEFENRTIIVGLKPDSPCCIQGDDGVLFPMDANCLEGAKTINQAFYLEWKYFLEGVSKREESVVSAGNCLLATKMLEEIYGSA